MNAGERIHELLKEKRISQKELAEALGISPSSVSDWKRGSVPSSENLVKAAQFLGVSIECLTEGKPGPFVNVQNNNGIIGSTHAPVIIKNGEERALSEQEGALLRIFSELDVVDRAKLLVYANELKTKK